MQITKYIILSALIKWFNTTEEYFDYNDIDETCVIDGDFNLGKLAEFLTNTINEYKNENV